MLATVMRRSLFFRAKAKGIIVDPLTGEYPKETPIIKEPQEELDDLRSPILKNHRPTSYQNNYDIRLASLPHEPIPSPKSQEDQVIDSDNRYQQSTDDMSVYHVDAAQKPYERDITYNNPYHRSTPSESFPTAHPVAPSPGKTGVQRSNTSASAFAPGNDPTQITRTTFPVPAPAGGPPPIDYPPGSKYGNPL